MSTEAHSAESVSEPRYVSSMFKGDYSVVDTGGRIRQVVALCGTPQYAAMVRDALNATHAQEAQNALGDHEAAWWRIIPKRSAEDLYRRRYATREDAERLMKGLRHRYKTAAFNRYGKLLPDEDSP